MLVTYHYPHPATRRGYSIDETALTAFMHRQGFRHEAIERLHIVIGHMAPYDAAGQPKEYIRGWYEAPRRICVFTHGFVTRDGLNAALLHELYHYKTDGYQPQEQKLPYHRRPSEQAAQAFAIQHRHCMLVKANSIEQWRERASMAAALTGICLVGAMLFLLGRGAGHRQSPALKRGERSSQ